MRAAILFGLLALAGCGGDNPGTAHDMAMPDLFVLSQCGHPGDTGNSLGVGQFCTTFKDCGGSTNLCSKIGNDPNGPNPKDTYFCTIYPCSPDAGTSECGENATCTCGDSGGMTGCACTPNRCLQ